MMKSPSLIVASCLVLAAACNKPASNSGAIATAAGATSGSTGSTSGKSVLGIGSTGVNGPNGKPVKQGVSKLTALTKTDVKIGDGVLLGVKVGTNKPVENGDLVSLEYVGKLQDGTTFDENKPGSKLAGKHDKPLTFYVGQGQVVPGLDQGVLGMKIGGERKIGIPPALGYGAQQAGPIPPNSDLLFDIKLLDDVKPGEQGIFDYKDLSEGSGPKIKKGDTVSVKYNVRLADGQVVDPGKDPLEFTIGSIPPAVISGVEQGVVGMKKGGSRLLRIPPGIGYGTKLVGGIPPNSTLVIQVTVLEVI